MINIRQSEEYRLFMRKIGWQVERVNDIQVFIKKFFLLGSFIKIQKINSPIPFLQIEKLAKKYRAFQIIVEPNEKDNDFKKFGYRLAKSTYSPSKTIQIDISQKEEILFKNFTLEKRRAIKKAIKNQIIIKSSNQIEEFIIIKNQKLGFLKYLLGDFQSKQIKALWKAFSPQRVNLLSAIKGEKMLAGVLLLFYDHIAYYWLAASTKEGNKLGVPSLLVWEAIKLSKKKDCKIFDFEGIEDSRYKSTSSWVGFTRFKEGFGGKEKEYSQTLVKRRFPF